MVSGHTPEFYGVRRSLENYEKTVDGQSLIVLELDSDLLKYLQYEAVINADGEYVGGRRMVLALSHSHRYHCLQPAAWFR